MNNFQPNPSQQQVLDCRRRLCVVAGAGSGKTGTLVAALVTRLAESLEPGYEGPIRDVTDILALTFTEKAAGELRERLGLAFSQLRRAAGPGPAGEFWRRQAARLDRADIGTIHGYALKLVRENAPLLGLTRAPALDEDDRSLGRDLAEQLTDWLDQGDRDLLDLLNDYPLASLHSMLEKCALRLSAWGLPRLSIQNPPSKGADSLGSGLRAFADLVAEGLDLVRHGDLNRAKPYYQTVLSAMEDLDQLLAESDLNQADYDALLFKCHELMKRGGQWYSKQGKPMRLRLLAALEELQAERVDQLAAPLKTRLLSLVNRLPAALAARKRRRGSINFDDILILARRLLATRPEVRRREIQRRRLVVVDEFQDTNRLQADLLAYLLLDPSDEAVYDEYQSLWNGLDWGRASERFSVFGDLKQSIYRFRGAESEIMTGLGQAFDQGGGQVLALDHNYRSQAPLVNFFNILFPAHLNEGFSSRDFQEARRPALYPGPQVVQLRSRGEAPSTAAERAEAQARVLVRYLDDLLSGRAGVLVDQGRPPTPGEVTILFQRFKRAPLFQEHLEAAGWKCRLAVGDNPFDYAEVRGLMAAFNYLSGLDPDLNLAALLRSPLGPVSDEALARLAWPEARSRALGLSGYFQPNPLAWPQGLDPADRQTLEELRLLMGDLRALVGRLRPVEILERLVEERRLLPLARPEPDGEQRFRAVTAFLALSRRLGRDRDHQAPGPAEELMEMARTWNPRRDGNQLDPEDDGALTLMTVHASKGLEFPVIIVAEADRRPPAQANQVVVSRSGQLALRFKNPAGANLDPSDFRAIEAEERALEAEENGRLFYVAATRARDHLVLLGWPSPKKEEERARALQDQTAHRETIWLEALLNCPEAAALSAVVEYDLDGPEPGAAPAASLAASPRPAEEEASEAPQLLAPMSLDSQTLAVTALCRLLAEPENLWDNILGLEQQPDEGRERPLGGPAIQKNKRLAPDQAGTLFHAVLEAVDPRAPQIEALLLGQAARLGLSPGPEEAADLRARLETFLSGPLGRAWQASPADYRELPFRLQLSEPGRLTLTGVIDLFFLSPEGLGQIVDYKLAAARPGPEMAAYEHQLRIYAQALVSAGFTGPLQAALYFAGGPRPYIHQVELDQASPLAPLEPLLEKYFELLVKARPLRPNRPAALNIV